MCSPVSISSDTVVEATESFAVILESTDPVVQVTQQFASVIIIDSEPSSKYTQSGYFVGGWRICLCVIAFVSAMHAVHSCTTLDRDNSPPHPYWWKWEGLVTANGSTMECTSTQYYASPVALLLWFMRKSPLYRTNGWVCTTFYGKWSWWFSFCVCQHIWTPSWECYCLAVNRRQHCCLWVSISNHVINQLVKYPKQHNLPQRDNLGIVVYLEASI